MIDLRYAIAATALIAITSATSVFGGLFIYVTQPELLSPRWNVHRHLVWPSAGIVTWLILWWTTRTFPNRHNLEGSLKKHYGLWLVFVCAICAFMQIILLGTGLEIFEHSPTRAKLFLAAVGLGMVVLGNGAGKLPSPYKGRSEPFSWDKMARFEGRLGVLTGLFVFMYAFAQPSPMAAALILLWSILIVVVMLHKRHHLKQEKRTEGL